MRKDDSFFENEVANMISPNRKAIFQTEFAKKIRAGQIQLPAGAFFCA